MEKILIVDIETTGFLQAGGKIDETGKIEDWNPTFEDFEQED